MSAVHLTESQQQKSTSGRTGQEEGADQAVQPSALRGQPLAVQLKALSPGAQPGYADQQAAASPNAIAASGMSGGGGPLPHLDTIQRSFGRHDVSNVRHHSDAAAAGAANKLGAQAFTMGDQTASDGPMDLHTAAHEAAHVVQQKGGVQLKGGMGQIGDAYERHADAVADTVVRGESAEALLDTMSGGASAGAGAGVVQRKEKAPDADPANAAPPEKQDEDEEKAEMSEGDRLRAAIADSATKNDGVNIFDDDDAKNAKVINDVRKGVSEEEAKKTGKKARKGMKGYTTCIDFAGKTMREGVAEAYGNTKVAQQTAKMLSQIKGDADKETAALVKSKMYGKIVATQEKWIARYEAKQAEWNKKADDAMAAAKEGENEWAVKRRHGAARQYRAAGKQYDNAIKKRTEVRDKYKRMADENAAEADAIAMRNSAMIKTEPGMTNGRPKKGEYIIMVQVAGGRGFQGPNGIIKVAGGAFKHIAVFMGKEDLGNGMEKWTTIDGGGAKGKTTVFYVRTADAVKFNRPNPKVAEPGKPWTGDQVNTQIGGWIDMDKLVEMRKQKYGVK